MKKLVLLIALIPSIAHSECKIDEKSVIYKEVPAYRLQGTVAQAYMKGDKHIIEYSTEVKYLPEPLRQHILAHECAHHRLKHTAMPIAYDLDKFEFEADCDAVKQLNWNSSDIDKLQSIWYTLYPKDYVNTRSESLKNVCFRTKKVN
jgi:hypothetical protein